MIDGLNEIIRLNKIGKFKIKEEDCHTEIEKHLIKNFGDVGKKIHTFRSRNDQVLVAMRMYEKSNLKKVLNLVDNLILSIEKKTRKFGKIKLPGYTHMQKAMPTTLELLFKAYIAALKDDKKLIYSVLDIINQNPLGSGAGFGVPVDKKITTKLLGFKKIQPTMYCQNSRGKFEALIVDALMQVMMSLNKISTDLILFSMKEFGFFSLPKEMCTGSSMMPQKKNPDMLELVRAKYGVVNGYSVQIKSIYPNLISGYNRDLQLTKEPVMKSMDIVQASLKMMALVFNNIKVNKEKCEKALTKELYATDEAYKLVKKGMPFRDAYQNVGKKYIDKL